jgi:YesN/AraC family two-component response regulator
MTGSNELWNYTKHSHSYLEIIFFLTGNIVVEINDDKVDVQTYNVLFYPPYVEHIEYKNSHIDQQVIAIGVEVDTSFKFTSSFKTKDNNNILKYLFEQIYIQYNSNLPKSFDLYTSYVKAILFTTYQYFYQNTYNNYDTVTLISDYINNNYSQEISISELAGIGSVSPSYLNRIFNQKMNVSPIKHLNNVRLKVAKQLLISSNLTIEEISNQVGYSNANYFWRIFKKCNNISPSEYRELF